MADYSDHLAQAKRNLKFLEKANQFANDDWDWQVTVAFYVVVHLANGHLAKQDLHYRTHFDVEGALNPFTHSPCRINEETWDHFKKLRQLSRRARYLIHEKNNKADPHIALFTYDKHFARAIKYLHTFMSYMQKTHNSSFPTIELQCSELKSFQSPYFNTH